nr:hypothetical protein [Clostridia bacterium]
MELREALIKLTELYGLPAMTEYTPLINGHINSTYHVTVENEDGKNNEYIFQKVNTYVFREPLKVMKNIKAVRKYICENGNCGGCGCTDERCGITEYLENRSGANYTLLEDGSFWRVSPYVMNSIGYEHVERPSVLYNAGYAFGDFIGQLSGMDPS